MVVQRHQVEQARLPVDQVPAQRGIQRVLDLQVLDRQIVQVHRLQVLPLLPGQQKFLQTVPN